MLIEEIAITYSLVAGAHFADANFNLSWLLTHTILLTETLTPMDEYSIRKNK